MSDVMSTVISILLIVGTFIGYGSLIFGIIRFIIGIVQLIREKKSGMLLSGIGFAFIGWLIIVICFVISWSI